MSWKNEEGKNGTLKFDSYVQSLLFERADIAKKATAKIGITKDILLGEYEPHQQWLVYCDDQDQIEQLRMELLEHDINALVYHSGVKPKRVKELTLDKFKATGGVLLSIKCLDEGVDIPSITHAIIIASDQNPRQFIQRRGRVLRRDPENKGKTKAFLYDLVVAQDPREFKSIKNLAISELRRSLEFSNSALNKIYAQTKLQEIASVSNVNINEISSEEKSNDFVDIEEQ